MSDATKSKSKSEELPSALVIGGAGFIGSYICESLIAQNVKVVALDDLSSGKEEHLENIKKNKNFEFLRIDIDQGLLPQIDNIKYIFHIGGIESYINGIDLSLKTMLVNSIGTYNILELARKNSAKVLLVSSLDIYGGVLSSLSLKNYFGLSDRDSKKYTHHEAKRYAEALLTEYYRKYEVNSRIVRVADVYGPRMDLTSGTEIAQLFNEAINTDSLTIHGDGLKVIHPTFVSDVVSGITKAMFTPDTNGKIYNITARDEINVLNFAYSIQKNSTKPLKIQFTQEYQEVKFPLHAAELQQTESDLAWTARTKLAEGVTQTLEYFFLKKPQEASSPPPAKPQPATPPSTTSLSKKNKENPLFLENMQSREVTPLPRSPEAEAASKSHLLHRTLPPEQPSPEVKKFSKLNAALLSSSLFIVLLLFIFPLASLSLSNGKSIESSYEALSQESQESAINAQRNISFGNVQYDNLEWFFNTIQKHTAYENTRSALQALEKTNTAIISQSRLKENALSTVDSLLKEHANSKQLESQSTQITANFLSIQNALIEVGAARSTLNQSGNELLLRKSETEKLQQILNNAFPLLSKYAVQSATIQNAVQFLSPSQNKAYLIVFQDTLLPDKYNNKSLGYAYLQLGKAGLSRLSIKQYLYKTDKSNLNQTLKDILNINKNEGWLPLNAIFLADSTLLKNLIISQESVTIPSLAQIVDANNVQEKLYENRSNGDFQYNLWNGTLNNLLNITALKRQKVASAISQGIQNEDIKIVSQDSTGNMGVLACDFDRLLQRDFVNPDDALYPVKSSTTPYCISLGEKQLSLQKNTEIQKNLTLEATPSSVLTSHFKLNLSVKNNSKSTFNEEVSLMLPLTTQLTNLQLSYPLALDKARLEKSDLLNTYTLSLSIEPGNSRNLIVEWDSPLPYAQLTQTGIYISKPFGSIIESLSASLNLPKIKSKMVQNTDLFLF